MSNILSASSSTTYVHLRKLVTRPVTKKISGGLAQIVLQYMDDVANVHVTTKTFEHKWESYLRLQNYTCTINIGVHCRKKLRYVCTIKPISISDIIESYL